MFLLMQVKERLWKQLETFRLSIEKKVEECGAQYWAFGLFGILNYPLFYLVWKYYDHTGYENLSLRFMATVLSALLLLKTYWPKILRPWLPVYWYFTLLFCLPFFFFFMLFMNGGNSIWMMSANTILFWLGFLVEPLSYLLILGFGISSAYLAFLLTQPDFVFDIGRWWGVVLEFVASFIVASFFSRKKYQFDEKKLQAMQTLSGALAHEIRTPLAGIIANIQGVTNYWPTLMSAYQIAKTVHSDIEAIRPSQLHLLDKTFDRIQGEINVMQTTINMLLMNVTLGKIKTEETRLYSIKQCIEQALQRYPFAENQKQLIHWEKSDDFFVKGNDLLLIHVLFNLLKNAFYHIKAANKGHIRLWLNTTPDYNQLHFRDTAKGIAASLLPHIFECFFSKTSHGSGIGLTFCKAAMEAFGGKIECESIESEYAEFILKFPKISLEPIQ